MDAQSGNSPSLVVHFIRHGEVHNPDKVFYGRQLGFHLSERGFEQAQQAGAALAEVRRKVSMPPTAVTQTSVVYHSPMLRARETAEVLISSNQENAKLAETLEQDNDLIEVRVPYELRPVADLEALGWNLYAHGRESEGYDVFPDVIHRVCQFVGRLRASSGHRCTQVVAVSHGDVCLTARLWAVRGMKAMQESNVKPSIGEMKEWGIDYPDLCSITTLVFGDDESMNKPEWAFRQL